MLYREWTLALFAVALMLPSDARAASFGTRSWAHLTPFEEQPGAAVADLLTDVMPTTTSAWLSDGPSQAAAVTPFGANHAEAVSARGFTASASSLWSDTFTIISLSGATGVAPISFLLAYSGSLDAGSNAGGVAQMTLRALIGEGENEANPLLPNVILEMASVERTESCHDASPACSAGPRATEGSFDLETEFRYDVPFRFAMLLEVLAENGGSVDFAPSSWLDRIQLPPGAILRAAGGWDYEDLAARVPEPGTGLLLALGLAVLGRPAAPRRSRSAGTR